MGVFVKKLSILLLLILCMSSCENYEKLTSYLKPSKELQLNVASTDFVKEISFLFVIDSSGSMNKFKETLATNIESFLRLLFREYPEYDYNFAITSMISTNRFNGGKLPFSMKDIGYKCNITEMKNLFLKTTANLGSYLRYSSTHLKDFSTRDLICILSRNIELVELDNTGSEYYFHSLSYIIQESERKFKSDFFGDDKVLVLFFLSDAVGTELNNRGAKDTNAHNIIAGENLQLVQSVMKGNGVVEKNNTQRIYSYAVVPDEGVKDTCGESDKSSYSYPKHMYSFIENTNGFRISICDELWGKKLVGLFDDLAGSFRTGTVFLNEVPKLDTVEIFFNNKKVPQDIKKGWSFNPENLSIKIGPNFDFRSYLSEGDQLNEETNFKIKYNPFNIDLLREEEN